MLPQDQLRQVVRQLDADGTITTIGVLILIQGDTAWIAPRPDLRTSQVDAKDVDTPRGKRRFYWPRAKPVSYSQLVEATKSSTFPRMTLTKEDLPELWRLSEEQLRGELPLPVGMAYPAQRLRSWVAKRDTFLDRIAPIIEGRDLADLLNDDELNERITARCKETNWRKADCWTYVNRYVFAGANKRGLLPLTVNSGGRNMPKFFAVTGGRASKAVANGQTEVRAMPMGESDRLNCRLGWDMFKKQGVTEELAWDQFSRHFYAASEIYVGPGDVKVTLLPAWQRPTLNQFVYHGRANDPSRSSWLFGLSRKSLRNDVSGYRGPADKGLKLLMQVGIIDSTSDDQNLCSESSTLLMLQSPHSTRIVEGLSRYTLGDYMSFEAVSDRTHLSAIDHAAADKVVWCKERNIDIKEGEWHSGTFASIRSDNGEGKSQGVMTALERANFDLEYTPSYVARAKNICEAEHLFIHRLVDWRMPGSTLGKMRDRGQKLETDSCVTFSTFVRHRVQAILHRNNVEDASHLLTVEMRRQGVPATRRGIFEYLRETGQVASAPVLDPLALRPHILPQIRAQIRQGGIHLWDPRQGGNASLIPGLVYWSEWLYKTGLLTQASRRPIDVTVSLDGAYVGCVYLKDAAGRFHQIDLQTRDEEKRRLTLLDWLCISDHDAVKRFLTIPARQESRISLQASIEDSAAAAKALRDKEKTATRGAKPKWNKRQNTRDEIAAQKMAALGLSNAPATAGAATVSTELAMKAANAETPQWRESTAIRAVDDDEGDDFMANLRARRAAGASQ